MAHIDESLIDLKTKRRRLQKRTKDTISEYYVAVVLIIFALSDWSVAIPMDYIRSKDLLPRPEDQDDMRQRLLYWHENATEETKAAMKVPATSNISQYNTAAKYVSELKLHSWVQSENMEKGIAPSSRDVLEIRRCILSSREASLSSSSLPPPLKRKEKKWLTTWRKRWNIGVGSFGQQAILSEAVMEAKALQCIICLHPRPTVN